MAKLTVVTADILSDIPLFEWMIRDKLPKVSAFSFAMGHIDGKFTRNHSNSFCYSSTDTAIQFHITFISKLIL